jgi:hypothetical protein
MVDYQFWFPLVGTFSGVVAMLGTLYSAYWQRKAIMMATEAQGINNQRGKIQLPIWWKSPAVLALFILSCSLWGPYILSKVNEEDRVRGNGGIQAATIDNSTGRFIDFTLYVSINGDDIYRYASSWRVMAVGFVWTIDRDLDDIQELQKSPVLEIRKDNMVFLFKGDSKFVDQVSRGAPVNYGLIILPKNLPADAFKTLRQAKDLGAKVVSLGSYY